MGNSMDSSFKSCIQHGVCQISIATASPPLMLGGGCGGRKIVILERQGLSKRGSEHHVAIELDSGDVSR